MKVPKVGNRDDANGALGQLAKIERDAEALRARAKAKCDEITRMAAESIGPLTEEKEGIEAALKAWFKDEVKTLGEARSVKLLFGTIGLFKNNPAVAKLRGWSWERCCDALREARRAKFVRIDYDVNKQAILDDAGFRGEDLAAFGMKIGQGETFYIELDPGDTKERLGS